MVVSLLKNLRKIRFLEERVAVGRNGLSAV